MENNLFEQDDKTPKQIAELAKQMAELSAKFDTAAREKEDAAASWQEEKARLEKTLSDQAPWVEAARGFNKLVNEDPDEAIARVINHKKKQVKEKTAPTNGSANMDEVLNPLKEKVSKLEAELDKDKQDRKIAEMQNAIYESVEYLKAAGVSVDANTPQEILRFMKTKGLNEPDHVDLAAKSLFSSALIEAKVKAKKKVNNEDPVVLGTNGFAGDDSGGDEIEPEDEPVRPQPRNRKQGPNDYYNDDKLWKTLERSL
jgi:hypothetical protein